MEAELADRWPTGDGGRPLVVGALEGAAALFGAGDGAFDDAMTGLAVLDGDGRYVRVNRAFCELLGRPASELLGHHPVEVTHPDDRDESVSALDGLIAGGSRLQRARKRYLRPDGAVVVVDRTATALRDETGRLRGVLSQVVDVTEASDAHDALRRVRQRRSAEQEALADLSRRALSELRLDELVEAAARAVSRIVGASHCSVLRLDAGGDLAVATRTGPPLNTRPYPVRAGGHPATVPARAILERRTIAWSGGAPDEPGLRHAVGFEGLRAGVAAVVLDGTRPWGAVVARATGPDALGEDDVSFVESVANLLGAAAARDRVERELRDRARTDELTGLLNRTALLERLTAALAGPSAAGEVAVLFVDADDLKVVNDSIGHAAGDAVIASVGHRIAACAGPASVVARFGGDEFVICYSGGDLAAATALAESVRDALAEPVEVAGRWLTVTASIGIAVSGRRATTPDELLSQADMAMYEAKRRGKDRAVTFDAEMRRHVEERLEVTSGLRRAIADGELVLHYQPIVSVDSGAVTGSEALVRWDRPGHGLIGPGGFIPHAEASGLILPIGSWVLGAACQQAAAWQAAGEATTVSLNVSGRQLASGSLVGAVAAALHTSGVDPGRVILEITESAVMDDAEHAARVMADLHALGVGIALDDFGTGYSSLSQLAKLPFDVVKIDQAFTGRVDRDPTAAAMLAAIAELCAAIGVRAVAEGVETAEQLCVVANLGIPLAQGFLLGHPVPAGCWPAPATQPPRGGPPAAPRPAAPCLSRPGSRRPPR